MKHRASDRPPGTARKPRLWRSRFEIGVLSSETAVGAPLHTTYWGLLKQPDKHKTPTQQDGGSMRLDVNDQCDGISFTVVANEQQSAGIR